MTNNVFDSRASRTDELIQSGSKEELLSKLSVNRDKVWDVAPYAIMVKCTQDLETKIGRLTDATNSMAEAVRESSRSSTKIGWGLIATGTGAWAYFGLELYKLLR